MSGYFTNWSRDIECVGKYLTFSYGKQDGNWFYESITLEDSSAQKQTEVTTRKETQTKSGTTRSYNSWTTGYKDRRSDSYAPHSYEATDIKCSDGTSGTVFDYYARDTSYRYIVNVTNQFQSFKEAANYICGNR